MRKNPFLTWFFAIAALAGGILSVVLVVYHAPPGWALLTGIMIAAIIVFIAVIALDAKRFW